MVGAFGIIWAMGCCNWNKFTGGDLIPLDPPENLTLITFDDRDVVIEWDPIEEGSVRGTFRGYLVRVWNHALSQVYAIPPDVTRTPVQFFPFSKNFITVAARNDKYVGPRSNAISFDAPQTVYAPVMRRKMLSVQMEQRVNLKFLVNLEKTFIEAYAILKEVYKNKCLFRTQVFEWFKRFKEGRETTEDDQRPGRPSTSNGAKTPHFRAKGINNEHLR
ncbi:hypothetical protein NQ318_009052 [Aromia moschata]|uniref:Fibronectin type-III domain-containing protein n=1 Tax=Aromia moschata TaxID=1265417 RepID=A0AAV8YVJ9_9CUCU|nr:hypothetical protein NQ318_009052 [Aromia moschata]